MEESICYTVSVLFQSQQESLTKQLQAEREGLRKELAQCQELLDEVHTYIHTYIPTYIHTYIHTYVHTYIHMYLHTYIRTYIHTYVHTYIQCTYIHTYIQCTYIHTHTYTHTLTCMWVDSILRKWFLLWLVSFCQEDPMAHTMHAYKLDTGGN